MSVVSKTYRIASGELRFDFHYSSLLGTLSDFYVLDISPLRYGYDSDDPKEVSVYPGNIELVIDDINGDHYRELRNFHSHYSAVYPFNHYDVFYSTISLNGNIVFKGVIDALSADYENRTVSLTLVDAMNIYKQAQVGNPYLLSALNAAGIVPRFTFVNNWAHAYGFGGLDYVTTSTIGQSVITPGYRPKLITTGDRDVPFPFLVRELVKALRSDMIVEQVNNLKYGDAGVPVTNYAGFDQVSVRRIMSTLLGRHVAIRKIAGRYNQIAEVDSDLDYQKPAAFNLVFEDDTWLVYYHNWSGVVAQNKYEKGVDERTLADLLKLIATNTYSYCGLRSSNVFYMAHKRRRINAIPLTSVLEISKALMIDQINEMVVRDYYTDNYARKGNQYNIDDQKYEYKIPLNAFATQNGFEYRMNYYVNGQEKRVIYFFDPELNITDIPQEYLSIAEWQYHRNQISRYEMTLPGVAYSMADCYRIAIDNYSDTVRPVTLSLDFFNDVAQMTALEI